MICPKCGAESMQPPETTVWKCYACDTLHGITNPWLEVTANMSEKELTIEFVCIGLPDFLKNRIMMVGDPDEYLKDFVDVCNKLAKEVLKIT